MTQNKVAPPILGHFGVEYLPEKLKDRGLLWDGIHTQL